MRARSPTCKGLASGAEEEPLPRMWCDHCACLRGHGGNLERGRATSSTDAAPSEDVANGFTSFPFVHVMNVFPNCLAVCWTLGT